MTLLSSLNSRCLEVTPLNSGKKKANGDYYGFYCVTDSLKGLRIVIKDDNSFTVWIRETYKDQVSSSYKEFANEKEFIKWFVTI